MRQSGINSIDALFEAAWNELSDTGDFGGGTITIMDKESARKLFHRAAWKGAFDDVLLAEAVELLTGHLECGPGEGCGRCDVIRAFLEKVEAGKE